MKRLLTILFSIGLIFSLLPFNYVYAAETNIYIDSYDDLLNLQSNCHLDTYSYNKTVILNKDITVDEKFTGLNIFKGTFNGNNHTISNITYNDNYANYGFIHYLSSEGVVENLNIEVAIGNSEDEVIFGSIASYNAGNIKNCSASGAIDSIYISGGIVGKNDTTGIVENCTNKIITSVNYKVGGIAGENYGSIVGCVNNGSINIDSDWLNDDESASSILTTVETTKVTDDNIGGICGYNEGIITSCTNNGDVGYKNSGYNIGGIVGKSTQTVSSCVNNGTVLGKQDVGGIVGQLVPQLEAANKQELKDAVKTLHDQINKLIDDLDKYGNSVDADLDSIQKVADDIGDEVDYMSDEAIDVINDDIEQLNNIFEYLDYVITELNSDDGALKHVSNALDDADKIVDNLKTIKDDLDIINKMEESSEDPAKNKRLVLLSSIGGNIYTSNSNPAQDVSVTLTFTPNSGYKLYKVVKNVRVNNSDETYTSTVLSDSEIADIIANDNKYTFDMPEENVYFEAYYKYDGKYFVTSNVGGTVSLAESDTQIKLTVTPDDGYSFDYSNNVYYNEVINYSDINNTNNKLSNIVSHEESDGVYTLVYNKSEISHSGAYDTNIYVKFTNNSATTYSIIETHNIGGTVSVNSEASQGDNVTITAKPQNENYKLNEIKINGLSYTGDNLTTLKTGSGDNDYVFTMPGYDTNIEVNFICLNNENVNLTSNISGSGSVVNNTTGIGSSNDYIITVTPDDGYQLGDGNDNSVALTIYDTSSPKTQLNAITLGQMSKNGNAYSYTLTYTNYNQKLDVEANFTSKSGTYYNVITHTNTGGRVAVDKTSVTQGDEISAVVASGSSYKISSLKVDGIEQLNTDNYDVDTNTLTYTVPEISHEVKIEATFDYVPVHFTCSSISGNATYSVNNNGDIDILVTPSSNYKVSTITASDGVNVVNVQKQKEDTEEYIIKSNNGIYTVNIEFEYQSDKDAVDDAKDRIDNNSDVLTDSMNDIQEEYTNIQDILTDDFSEPRSYEDLSSSEKTELEADILNLADDITDAGVAAASIISDLSTIEQIADPYLNEAYDKLFDDGGDFDQLNDNLDHFVDELSAASDSLERIFDYLDSKDKIVFRGLSDEFKDNSDKLGDNLDTLSTLITSLRGHVKSNNDILETDLRNINDQLNNVFDIISDKLDNIEDEVDARSFIEDKSSLTESQNLTSFITTSTNNGLVKGNYNVGGIAGSIDVEGGISDLYGDDTELSVLYYARAVVKNCKNYGIIVSKNNYTGGIVGYEVYGIIYDCIGSGSATSDDGNYIGGIVGSGEGVVDKCYSLAEIGGSTYVGGIAGKGEKVSNCYSLAYTKDDDNDNMQGAIIGSNLDLLEDLASNNSDVKANFHDNYYVSDSLYGIDGLSYLGICEPISYNQLIVSKDVPTDFINLKVYFADEDGKLLGTQNVKYGDSVDTIVYPTIKVEDNYSYNDWYGLKGDIITSNLVLRVVSEDINSIISGGEKINGKSQVLVAGDFSKDCTLKVEKVTNIKSPDDSRLSDINKVTIENSTLTDTSKSKVRVYKNNYKDLSIYLYDGSSWTQVETKEVGSYLEFDVTGTSFTYCLSYNEASNNTLLYVGIGSTIGVIAIASVIIAIKKKKQNS